MQVVDDKSMSSVALMILTQMRVIGGQIVMTVRHCLGVYHGPKGKGSDRSDSRQNGKCCKSSSLSDHGSDLPGDRIHRRHPLG